MGIVFVLIASIGATSVNAVPSKKSITLQKADFHFIVDGQVYHAPKESQGFLYNNRTYVPVRFASYLVENWVEWNQTTSTVSVTVPSATQLKQLQSYKAQYLDKKADVTKAASGWKQEKVTTSLDVATFNFFGKVQANPSDATTFLYDGTLYVPIRYFAELVDLEITYQSSTKSVIIKTRNQSGNGSGNEPGSGSNGGSSNGSSNENPGTGSGNGAANGGNTSGGSGEQVVPTREELVSATKAELTSLKNSLTSKVYNLYTKYSEATSDEDKQKYLAEGVELLTTADIQVENIADKLNQELAKYDYELGNDAADLLAQYKKEKAALYTKLMSS